jgi:hypothetical protein
MEPLKAFLKVNFMIPIEAGIEIDKILISIKESGVRKSKNELLSELVQLGIKKYKDTL